jgi:hypothetical protein
LAVIRALLIKYKLGAMTISKIDINNVLNPSRLYSSKSVMHRKPRSKKLFTDDV